MLEKKDLIVGKKYKCKITEGYALSQNEPTWTGKIATLRYTGFMLQSVKDGELRLFCPISDVEVIEEVK